MFTNLAIERGPHIVVDFVIATFENTGGYEIAF